MTDVTAGLLLTFVAPPSLDHEDNMAAESWTPHGSRAAPHQTCFCVCFKHWGRFYHDLHHRKSFRAYADKPGVKQQPGRLQISSCLSRSFGKVTEVLETKMNLCTLALLWVHVCTSHKRTNLRSEKNQAEIMALAQTRAQIS